MAAPRICSIPNCGNPHQAKGLCRKHYLRKYKTGKLHLERTAPGEPFEWLARVALAYEGDECLEWPFGRNAYGYGIVTYKAKQRIASRVICEIVNGSPPHAKDEAAHSCGNGHLGCVNKKHLSWKTRSGNHADRVIHGTASRGERSNFAKLTENDVINIRDLSRSLKQREIASFYGVDQSTVSDIIRGKSWFWL